MYLLYFKGKHRPNIALGSLPLRFGVHGAWEVVDGWLALPKKMMFKHIRKKQSF